MIKGKRMNCRRLFAGLSRSNGAMPKPIDEMNAAATSPSGHSTALATDDGATARPIDRRWAAEPTIALIPKCILFINLAFRKDRLENMLYLLAKSHFPVRRFEAVWLEPEEQQSYMIAPWFDKTSSVVGIFLSHMECIELALENQNDGGIVVLEDDVEFDPDLFTRPLALPASLPDTWEVIMGTPRYRCKLAADITGEKPRAPWLGQPWGRNPVRLADASKTFHCNGTHFLVYKNNEAARNVLKAMQEAKFIKVRTVFSRAFRTPTASTSRRSTSATGVPTITTPAHQIFDPVRPAHQIFSAESAMSL
jgi:hypothetical protein